MIRVMSVGSEHDQGTARVGIWGQRMTGVLTVGGKICV